SGPLGRPSGPETASKPAATTASWPACSLTATVTGRSSRPRAGCWPAADRSPLPEPLPAAEEGEERLGVRRAGLEPEQVGAPRAERLLEPAVERLRPPAEVGPHPRRARVHPAPRARLHVREGEEAFAGELPLPAVDEVHRDHVVPPGQPPERGLPPVAQKIRDDEQHRAAVGQRLEQLEARAEIGAPAPGR